MSLSKLDELDALIAGILYIDTINTTECYYYAPSEDEPKDNWPTPVSLIFILLYLFLTFYNCFYCFFRVQTFHRRTRGIRSTFRIHIHL